ncbi:MAG: S24 family peptidase, partial [Planctomycetaceae bacterium]
ADGQSPKGLTTLADLIARQGIGTIARPATAAQNNVPLEDTIAIVSLREPDKNDVTEYISAAKLKAAHPDAFAVRIDGESMSPDIRHGDLAVLSPSVIARDGRPAVVQLEGQIGVTCKLYRRVGGMVHLVPINEQFPPVAIPASQVVWALGVLATVRG